MVFDMSQSCLLESLVADLSGLIAEVHARATVAVNAEITLLFWQIERRIRIDVLREDAQTMASRFYYC